MTLSSSIELTGVPIKAQIGIFEAGGADPYEHTLDLKLEIDSALVFIERDGMQNVFDYDPLLESIHQISQNKHYETQEMLASLIVRCCAAFKEIRAVEICLKKFRANGHGGTVCGMIGVTIQLSAQDFAALRPTAHPTTPVV